MVTLLRVSTGVAAVNPPSTGQSNSTGAVIVIPHSLNESVSVPQSTPQFQNPAGNGLDASFLLAALFVGANIVVISLLAYLYRKKRMKLFSIIVSVFLIFNVTELYVSFITGLYSALPFIAAAVASLATILAAFGRRPWLVNALALVLALELGSSFPVLLQTPLNWIVPAVYSFFDIYAIYFGRLGRLVRQVGKSRDEENPAGKSRSDKTDSQMQGISQADGDEAQNKCRTKRRESGGWPDFGLLTVNIDKIEIGMADIAFYSMVPAVALIIKNMFAFVVVLVAVDAGLLVSFYAFRNKDVAPGLPIPILSGLAALLIVTLLF